MVDITRLYSDPFFTGLASSSGEDLGLPVSVGSRGFLLDTRAELRYTYQFQRSSINLLNTQQATNESDLSLIPPEVWRRVSTSWEYGAGQEFSDERDSNPNRYYKSTGINPWVKGRFSLLNSVWNQRPISTGATKSVSFNGNFAVFVASTTKSGWWWDGTTYTAMTVPTQAAVDATTDGSSLYSLHDNGDIRKWTNPTTSTVLATVPTPIGGRMMLRFIKGFLVVGNGKLLINYSVPGSPVTIYQHPMDDWTWRGATDGMTAGYLLGGSGSRWHVCAVTANATGANLEVPRIVASLPSGEVGLELGSYLGFLLIGLSNGWRFAEAQASGVLRYGRLIETGGAVRCFEGQDRFVWYGADGTPAKLGRADLSVFTSDLTPAYANDLQSTLNGSVTGIHSFGVNNAKRMFVVESGAICVQEDSFVDSGELEQGFTGFGSADLKKGLYAQLSHLPLALGCKISVYASVDRGAYELVGSNSSTLTTSVGNMKLPSYFTSLSLKYVLDSDEGYYFNSPTVERTEFRAVAVPGRASEWRIPLVVASEIVHDGVVKSRDVVQDYDVLVDLVQRRGEFTYREATRTWLLYATDFVWIPYKMTSDGQFFDGTFVLTAREVT
jgi:hypothetical protein